MVVILDDDPVKLLELCDEDPNKIDLLVDQFSARAPSIARPFFEHLLSIYSTCGHFWRVYCEYELRHLQIDRVQALFGRSLPTVLSVELYTFFLSFMHALKHKSRSFRDIMGNAYDFVIDKVGLDMQSYPIWRQYVSFLRSVCADNAFADNQKVVSVRKIFQRAVLIPISGVEHMWKDYCAFEISINVVLAKRVIDERSREYLNVKRVAKELDSYTKVLDRDVLVRVGGKPVWRRNTSVEYYEKQVQAWKRYIRYEMSNPLKVQNHWYKVKRVVYAYEQCILCLGHRADVWYEAAEYMCSVGRQLLKDGDSSNSRHIYKEVGGLFERAISGGFMRDNQLLRFAYSNFLELRLDYEASHLSYKNLIAHHQSSDRNRLLLTLAYINYMRFARRVEGIDSYRNVFKKARSDPKCGSCEIFVAGALNEFQCTKRATIAAKIFEIGLKQFSHNPNYLQSVADFWLRLSRQQLGQLLTTTTDNDDDPFESSETIRAQMIARLCKLAPNDAMLPAQIMENYFPIVCCSQRSIVKIKQTQASMFSHKSSMRRLIDRYAFKNKLFPCDNYTLRSMDSSGRAKKPTYEIGEQVYVKPNTAQMKRFVPMSTRPLGHVGVNICDHGLFSYPAWASFLLRKIPPPYAYRGPFVLIDGLIEIFKNLKLPDKYDPVLGEYFAQVQSLNRKRTQQQDNCPTHEQNLEFH